MKELNYPVTCSRCKAQIAKPDNATTGYGLTSYNRPICFACCADKDAQHMHDSGSYMLYLCAPKSAPDSYGPARKTWTVQNWPGSLSIVCTTPRRSPHNIARWRYDVWFDFDGAVWHGVQYGDNTQICHVRRTKKASAEIVTA